MTALVIGQWVGRQTARGRALGKAHLIESLIADEPITRCGRRLRHIEGTEIRAVDTNSATYCSVCWNNPPVTHV